MASLIYTAIMSLDGYVADERGTFDWAVPDEEVHGYINDLERPIGTCLYGRRMYETMVGWETMPDGPDQPHVIRDFAEIWRAATKVVYSRTLDAVSSGRTTIERNFDPGAVRNLKETAVRDIGIGGAELAGQAARVGLIDELHLFVAPVVVGRGTPFLAGAPLPALELVDERRFGSGMVHLHYRTA